MKSIIFDTNAYSNFKKGDPRIIKEIENCDKLIIASISVGELYSGFYKGDRFEDNEKELKQFLNNIYVKVIDMSINTAKIYGKIYSILVKKGTPIPTNDIWIAACAIETNSTLVTYDKHFLNIPHLKLWNGIKK